MHLSSKDGSIIRELFGDARASYSQIGRKCRLSKEVVGYRIRRMHREGLVVGYNTVIDVKRLGWRIFFIYLRLHGLQVSDEERVTGILKGHPNVAQVFKCVGSYDAVIKVFVREYDDIKPVIKSLESQLGSHFEHYEIDYVTAETAVPFRFLYMPKEKTIRTAKYPAHEASAKDYLVMKELAKNARMNVVDIAARTGMPPETVKYRIRQLEKSGIILKYRPDVLPKVLGYNWHLLTLKTGELGQLEPRLKSYLIGQANVTYFYQSIGGNDIQVEIRTRTTNELARILLDIRSIMGQALRRFEILIILDEPKYTYFPDCLDVKPKK
ncbi:Lrp/AsnC family transcriptional regulator [Candidatus Woesearchaeota archaeon]|nr:Lrp/AsnC family transcriptional regulator [Candidatus Woesearchaeota archaeon]